MKRQYIRSIFGKWSRQEARVIEQNDIKCEEGYYGFTLIEDEKYFKLLPFIKNAIEFNDRRVSIIISNEELDISTSLLLHNYGPALEFPARLRKEDDSFDYLRYAFGEICSKCNRIPKGEQVKPLTLAKEPKLSKKYLWGGFHGVSGYVFTDLERFEKLNKKWGLGKREVLIGAKQKISHDFVQIEIPISSSPLCFGDSDFGNTFKLDDSGEIEAATNICSECNRPLYTNQILDYFPSFKEDVDYDIVFTQEWFGWYRRLVISRKFADWLRENRYLEWNSNYIIPIKNFCK